MMRFISLTFLVCGLQCVKQQKECYHFNLATVTNGSEVLG